MTSELEEALIELAHTLRRMWTAVRPHRRTRGGPFRRAAFDFRRRRVGLDRAGIPGDRRRLSTRLKALHSDARAFAEARRVLPVLTGNGIRADIVFAALPIEREMIRRGIAKQVGKRTIPVASVEDLVFMKLLSIREKDLADVRALLRRFGKSLDRAYLLPKLQEAAEGLDRPEILRIFEQAS